MCGLSPFGQVRYTEKRCILAFLLGVHIRIYLTPPQLHLRNNEKPVFSIMNHSQTLDLHLAGVPSVQPVGRMGKAEGKLGMKGEGPVGWAGDC